MFYNKIRDKKLGIHTTGVNRLSAKDYPENFQTESTDYYVLDELFKKYALRTSGRFIDFGCGKGRVLFYLHHEFNQRVVGIELNPTSFSELDENLKNYSNKYPHSEQDITIYQGYAEEYQIQAEDTIFYFFNPFSLRIVKKIFENILDSIRENPREIEIIFYYPNQALVNLIAQLPQIKLYESIQIQGTRDKNDIVNIYHAVID